MAHNYVWGSQNEMFVLAHMAGVNIASYNTTERQYHFHNPGVIDTLMTTPGPAYMLNIQVTTSMWYSHRSEHPYIVSFESFSHNCSLLFSFQTLYSLCLALQNITSIDNFEEGEAGGGGGLSLHLTKVV